MTTNPSDYRSQLLTGPNTDPARAVRVLGLRPDENDPRLRDPIPSISTINDHPELTFVAPRNWAVFGVNGGAPRFRKSKPPEPYTFPKLRYASAAPAAATSTTASQAPPVPPRLRPPLDSMDTTSGDASRDRSRARLRELQAEVAVLRARLFPADASDPLSDNIPCSALKLADKNTDLAPAR